MDKELLKKIIEFKERAIACNLDITNVVYFPYPPIIGFASSKEVVFEEILGVKIGKYITANEL